MPGPKPRGEAALSTADRCRAYRARKRAERERLEREETLRPAPPPIAGAPGKGMTRQQLALVAMAGQAETSPHEADTALRKLGEGVLRGEFVPPSAAQSSGALVPVIRERDALIVMRDSLHEEIAGLRADIARERRENAKAMKELRAAVRNAITPITKSA